MVVAGICNMSSLVSITPYLTIAYLSSCIFHLPSPLRFDPFTKKENPANIVITIVGKWPRCLRLVQTARCSSSGEREGNQMALFIDMLIQPLEHIPRHSMDNFHSEGSIGQPDGHETSLLIRVCSDPFGLC